MHKSTKLKSNVWLDFDPRILEAMGHVCDVESIQRCAANGDLIMNTSLQTDESILTMG